MIRQRQKTVMFVAGTFMAFGLLTCLSCTARHFDAHVRESGDIREIQTLETQLRVTPEKAAVHPEYQVLENIAVPYFPEYRIGPGDIVEIVYYIAYAKTDEDYRLEIQDKISINFPFHPQYSSTVLVRTDGKITVPLIGDIEAESKTPEELAAILNEKYGHYLQNPSITVALEAFNVKIDELKRAITTAPRGQSKIAPVTADGRISFPIIGTLQAEGYTLSQLEDIVNDRYAEVVRNLHANLILLEIHHNDYYVLGEVEKPGRYELTSRMNLLDGLALANGYTRRANLKQVVLFRNDGLERTVAYKIDMASMLKTGAGFANLTLRPADVVFVPKTSMDSIDDLIEKFFTKGVYGIMPFSTHFSWGEKDLGGDGDDDY